jgi:hypothetical protein
MNNKYVINILRIYNKKRDFLLKNFKSSLRDFDNLIQGYTNFIT